MRLHELSHFVYVVMVKTLNCVQISLLSPHELHSLEYMHILLRHLVAPSDTDLDCQMSNPTVRWYICCSPGNGRAGDFAGFHGKIP